MINVFELILSLPCTPAPWWGAHILKADEEISVNWYYFQ